MAELANRIAAQRRILKLVNTHAWGSEELFGLSAAAIERWATGNRLHPQAPVVGLVRSASEKLLFLANRSQEEISEEYQLLCEDVAEITAVLEAELRRLRVRDVPIDQDGLRPGGVPSGDAEKPEAQGERNASSCGDRS